MLPNGTLLPRANAASSPHLADADIRVLNEESGFDPQRIRSIHPACLSALVTDRAMEAWYHPLLHE
jgi:hypothetical protein